MSSAMTAAAAARTRRPPQGKGRFDPSEPLHMTTRHAARNGRVNGTPSSNGSMDDGDYDSQQDFADDINVMSAEHFRGPHSPRENRISGTSVNDASAANFSFETHSSTNNLFGHSSQLSPGFQSTSPSRKRKRSTPSPTNSINGAQDSLLKSVADMMESDPRDFVEVVPPEDLSDRDSDGSVESDEPFEGDYLGVAQSTENTPAVTPLGSQAVSPVSEESNPDMLYPTKQANVVLPKIVKPDEADEVDDVDDAEDLMDVDEAEDVDDIEDDQGRDDFHRGPRRRLAGRRRAEHHDPKVEATMRRQLQLKSTFRAIARALKPVLAEIALKTVENLEESPNLHEQVVEYRGTEEERGIQQLLDDALARRKAQLEAQFRWNKWNLEKTLQSEDSVRRSRCAAQTEDFRDVRLDQLEHDLLTVARRAQLNSGDAGYETEDEGDDVVPRPHGVGYRFVRTGALDAKYDSRSRLALESEKAVHDLQTRFDMFKMLKEVHEEDRPEGMATFTVMDSTAREAADARRESILNTRILADAAAETERIEKASMPIVPNEEAIALQILGDLANQSARAVAAPATPQQPKIASLLRATPPAHMPPPPMTSSNHVPISLEGPGPLLEASPRFTIFQERQSNPLASPLRPISSGETHVSQSPRMEPRMLSQSPRREPAVMSPIFHADRGQTLPPINLQPRDADRGQRYEQLLPPPPLPPTHHRRQSRELFDRERRHQDIFRRDVPRPEVVESSHMGAPVKEETSWDQYHRSTNADRSPRLSSSSDRPVHIHDFSRGGPLRIERVETMEPSSRSENARAPVNNDIFMIDPALTASSKHDRHSSFTRFSPLVEPTHARQRSQEVRGPIEHPSPVLDPALRQPLPEPRLPATFDTVAVDPALSRSLLQEEYQPHPPPNASPSRQLIQKKQQQPWDAPSSPGAPDSRDIGQRSPLMPPRDTILEELSRKPRSRTSSILSQSTTTEASPDVSVSEDSTRRRSNHSGTKQVFGMKANKSERKGSTRKTYKNGRPGPTRKSQNIKGSEGGPSVYRFRLNSIESTPSAPWSNTSAAAAPSSRTSNANDMWPVPASFAQSQAPPNAQSGHPLPPPPPGAYPYGYTPDFGPPYQHRNSFPQSGQAWAQQPSAPSPLYALPQGTQPPGASQAQPGGGPPPDQWPSPSVFAPPARSSQQPSRNGQQLAGPPPLAPAIPDSSSLQPAPLAAGANHLPAFAQQQRNQETNPRRRAASEIQGHSFKHWAPRSTNR